MLASEDAPRSVTEPELVQLFRDAMGEFINARGGNFPERYVAERYAHQSEAFRAAKLVEVRRRLDIALSLSVEGVSVRRYEGP